MDKIEGSDSYAALLWSTMGVAILTLILYIVQIARDGELIIPDRQALKELFTDEKEKKEDPEPKARSLMSLRECVESFLVGMGRVFPASIVLTLAWASGSVMSSVGCDRLFASWIVGGISPESLPTLSFLISLFMALAVSCKIIDLREVLSSMACSHLKSLADFCVTDWNVLGYHEYFVPSTSCPNL